MFSEAQLAEIRERISIETLVGEYVQLKKTGKNLKGLCPFHQEKTPSFIVSPDRETFHCFGCGAGGNLFHFLMKIDALSFPEAVLRLAQRAGVTVDSSSPLSPAERQRRDRFLEIHRQTAWYYHCLLKQLPTDSAVRKYLSHRQIAPESCEGFFLGYCPPSDSGLKAYLIKRGFSLEEVQAASLYGKGDREFFRGRLLFPIFRSDGKVVGFGGRLIDEKDYGPKYINSPESEIFKKSEIFYGMNLGRSAIHKKNQAIVVEGYLDVITLHAHGFNEAIAPLGTAFTTSHARALHRLCEQILLIFDGDQAGEKAAQRALEAFLPLGHLPFTVNLGGGEDPDSFLKRYGRLAFEKNLKSRRNLLEDLIDKWSAAIPPGSSQLDQIGQTARRVLAMVEKIPEPIVQNLYRRRLAETLQIPEDWLGGLKPLEKQEIHPSTPKGPRPNWYAEEEAILEIWLKYPELRPHIHTSVQVEDFCTKEAADLAGIFWELAQQEPHVTTGKYFDLAPGPLIGVLSELSLKPDGLEDLEAAQNSLEQAILRLKEKRLRQDLNALKGPGAADNIALIQDKIQALGKILKNKERMYDEGKFKGN